MGYTHDQFVIETRNFNKSQNDIETSLYQYISTTSLSHILLTIV